MSVPDVIEAVKPDVSERTVRKFEAPKPKEKANDATVRAIAKALSDPGKGIVCNPRFIAWWRLRDGKIEVPDSNLIDPSIPKPAPLVKKAATKDDSAAEATTPTAKRRALTENAERERAIGRDRDVVKLASGKYPLIGCDWLQELENQFAEHLGSTFAVAGLVTDQRPIPAKAAAELGADIGRGAAYFKIEPKAGGLDDDGETDSVSLFPTVFAVKGDHGKVLSRCLKEKLPVTVLVHIVTTERKPAAAPGERWEGFFVFEAGRPTPKLWALVVDDVIIGEDAPREQAKTRKPKKAATATHAPGGVPLE